jgi:putative transposase
VQLTLPQLHWCSTHDRARRLAGERLLRRLTRCYARQNNPVLRRPVESKQYASELFQKKLKAYGMIFSMSRKGNCWDNAPTESFFNSLKNERVQGMRYATRAEATADLFDYIEVFYNRSRRHSMVGYKSPIQFLQHWITTQHEPKLAA